MSVAADAGAIAGRPDAEQDMRHRPVAVAASQARAEGRVTGAAYRLPGSLSSHRMFIMSSPHEVQVRALVTRNMEHGD